MKKLLLLAASLVMSVGAWAQGTLELQASTENNWEHQYRLRPRNENGNYWLTAGLHSGNEESAGKFAFVEQGTTGNYYVYSVDEGKWLSYSNTSTGANKITLSATKDAYFAIESGTCTNGSAWGDKKGYVLKASSADVYMNFFQGPTSNNYQTTSTIGFWSDKWGDAGSVWVLESPKTEYFTEGVVYRMHLRDGGTPTNYNFFYDEADSKVKTRHSQDADAFDANHLFYFKKVDGGYTLHCLGAGEEKGLHASSTNNSHAEMTESPTAFVVKSNNNGGFALQCPGVTSAHLNDVEGVLGVWNTTQADTQNDKGSNFTLTEITADDIDGVATASAAAKAAAKDAATYTNIAALFSTDGPTTSPFDPAKEYVLKNVADNRGYVAYNPANNQYVGLADVGYTEYASKHAQSSNPEVGIKWNIIPTSDGKVKLYNIKKGKYMSITTCDSRNVFEWSDTGYEFVYEEGEGYFAFRGNGTPNNSYLCPAPAYNADKGPVVLDKSTMANEYKFIIEEPKEGYTLHVGETGYASMFLDKKVTIPAGVKVYYCPEEWQDYVLKTVEIANDQVLPSYTAYVIEAPANQDYFFPYTEAEAADYRNVDGLWGCASKAMNRQELHEVCSSEWGMNITHFYVLSVVDGKAGFYRYIGEEFALNKAFYFHPTSVANETQGFVLDFGGQTTGVDNVTTTTQSAASYDLQGRRVSKATRGLFIQNGVKVIR